MFEADKKILKMFIFHMSTKSIVSVYYFNILRGKELFSVLKMASLNNIFFVTEKLVIENVLNIKNKNKPINEHIFFSN